MDEGERSDRMSELIDRSSLGTSEARLIRSYTSASDVTEVLESAASLRARERPRALPPAPGMARRFSAPGGQQPSAAALSGRQSAGRTALWLLAGIGAVTSGLLLVTGNWHLQAVAVWATTAVLIFAARRVAERFRRTAADGDDRVPSVARPRNVATSVEDGVAEERSGGTTSNGGIQRH